jgi:hypothetical protein
MSRSPENVDNNAATDRLIGTWRMVRRVVRDAGGNVLPVPSDPKGWHAISMGLITFNEHGRVMSVLCDGRPSEDTSLPREYSSDCGSYTFDGTTLVMKVDASTPDRLGTEQVRKIRFEGDFLVLLPPAVTLNGAPVQREIVWERISRDAA